jgi:hypothetical protein
MQALLDTRYAEIDKSRIMVDPGEILKHLGEQQGGVDTHTAGLVKHFITESLRISTPAGVFVLAEALESSSAEKISIPGLAFDSGKIIHKMLRHSESYVFFLVTAGPEPENLARSLMTEGSYLEGYIVDLAASAIVDLAADQIQEQVRNLAENRGVKITNRYSPGYCSWNVVEQQKLFSLFPEGCCGISLSESSLMNPVKSVSGIIGIGTEVAYRDYTCEICPMLNCHFRKVRDH